MFQLANCFVILTDNYVTSESGTGVVHQAPYFGEDDLRICLQHGVVSKDQEPVCPVNSVGHFVAPVSHFEGKYVKVIDKNYNIMVGFSMQKSESNLSSANIQLEPVGVELSISQSPLEGRLMSLSIGSGKTVGVLTDYTQECIYPSLVRGL